MTLGALYPSLAQLKTLHFYLTRQMLATLGMTVFVFTFLLVLCNGIKEILSLLIKHEVTLGVALEAIALFTPWVLAYSLPVGMLTAALLVFGRFSADSELTAARASGVSLLSMITPVLLLSVAVSAVCAWLNFDIAPASRMAYKELLAHAAIDRPTLALQNNEPMYVGLYGISAAKILRDGTMSDVIVTQDDTNGVLKVWAHGTTGDIQFDQTNHIINITLHETHEERREDSGHWVPGMTGGDVSFPIPTGDASQSEQLTPISDMTLIQLLHRKAQVEREFAIEPLSGKKSNDELRREQRQLRENVAGRTLTPVLVNLHREVAFSFACVGFTLIGIPLGVRGHRRETSVGIAIALALMLLYYSFIVLALAWSAHPERGPQYIVWLPNFIFQAAGAVLLWRANRGI